MRSDVRKIARGVRKVYRAGKAVGRGLGKAWQGVGKLAVGIQSMSKAIRRKGKRAMAQLDQRQRAPHQPKPVIPGKRDIGAQSIRSLEQAIAGAKAGDRNSKDGLAKANAALLKSQGRTRTREVGQLGSPPVKRDYLILNPVAGK